MLPNREIITNLDRHWDRARLTNVIREVPFRYHKILRGVIKWA
jgi:hypothetical protein